MEWFAPALEQKAPIVKFGATCAGRIARETERKDRVSENEARATWLFAATVERATRRVGPIANLVGLGASAVGRISRRRNAPEAFEHPTGAMRCAYRAYEGC